MKKGVRQGDSLSPFFVPNCGKRSQMLFEQARELGLSDGVFTSSSLLALSLVQFVDDTLMFIPIDLE